MLRLVKPGDKRRAVGCISYNEILADYYFFLRTSRQLLDCEDELPDYEQMYG